ncbi:uncharacterized protein LOC116844587 [Odontomachus brunneus]|uniref:uncharacterized protein LOC116844587 n=1 Tax=Odontomachus brunneus TaxID=486640 RepID=UPI0013F25F4B|nr:uncharacterized protein LOC116844587 [Odontomachus brunneus]
MSDKGTRNGRVTNNPVFVMMQRPTRGQPTSTMTMTGVRNSAAGERQWLREFVSESIVRRIILSEVPSKVDSSAPSPVHRTQRWNIATTLTVARKSWIARGTRADRESVRRRSKEVGGMKGRP